MGLIGILGIILSALALPIASRQPTNARRLFAVGLLVAHICSSAAYYLYVQTAPADTNLYYYDVVGFTEGPFQLGTPLTVKFTQFLKRDLGASYLDCFLFFQSMGFAGILLLMRLFQEIHEDLELPMTTFSYVLLCLPGVHFWTSAIGKDAPLFLGVSLTVWSVKALSTRIPFLAFGIVLILLFRPHIAMIALGALALAMLFDGRTPLLAKLALVAATITGLALAMDSVEDTLKVDVLSSNSVDRFFDRYNSSAEMVEGTTNVRNASYPAKVFGLLFRPLFFDAQGAFGLIASFENLLILVIVGTLVAGARLSLRLAMRVMFLRFALFFSVMVTAMLAFIWYNVGLGLRQKMMIMPALFAFFVAHWAVYHARRRAGRRERRAALLHRTGSPLTGSQEVPAQS